MAKRTPTLNPFNSARGPQRPILPRLHLLLRPARTVPRLFALAAVALTCLGLRVAAADGIPASYSEVANRVFSRTAPNGVVSVHRLLAGNTFEPAGGYLTNRADYVREGLPANQARLVLASTARFGGVYAWMTNQYLLTFESALSGTYSLDTTLSSVPGVQHFEGPFSFSTGNNIVPQITQQPSSGAYVLGQNISALSVGAIGFDLTYQWYRNGVAVPGATQSSYIFRPMSADHVGEWTVVITNPLGSVTSEPAHVEVAVTPVITAHPQPVQVFEGGSATFTVAATGGGLNYQWLFNGNQVGSPNTPTLTVTNVGLAVAGFWSVEVFNNAGRVTSQAARLGFCSPGLNHLYHDRPWVKILASGDPLPGTPNRLGTLAVPFSPLFALRDQTLNIIVRGDNDQTTDAVHRGLLQWRDGTLSTLVFTNTPNPRGGFFEDVFYPTETGDGAINFAFGSMFEFRNGVVREVIGPDTDAPGRAAKIFGPGSFARRGSHVVIASTVGDPAAPLPAGTGLYLHDGTQLRRLCDDTTDLPGVLTGYAFRGTEDSVNLDEQTVVFSTITGLNGAGGVFKSTYDGVITKLVDSGDGYQGFGDVDVEGGTIFAVAGVKSGNSFINRVLAFPNGEAGAPVQLGLGEYLVAAGSNDVFFGSAGGIQRWKDGTTETVINTSALLDCKRIKRLVDVEAQGDDVAIAVEFQDGTAGVFANFGRATTGGPRILGQPQDVTTPETAPAVFAVSASGPAPIQYQWRKNGVALPGQTAATLTLLGVGTADLAEYEVVVTAGGSSVTSRAASLDLLPAPVTPQIYSQPTSTTVPAGTTATLSVLASGAAPLTYQWRLGTNAVAGATRRTFSLTPTTNASFNVIIANAGGSITSQIASVQVQPIITRAPQSTTVAAGGTATFSVEASGFESYRYLWFKDGTFLTGQTNATLQITNAQATDAGAYSVSVFGTGGSGVRTTEARLTVGGGGGGGTPDFTLGVPAVVAGKLTFSLPTTAGKTYEIQFQSALGAGAWSTLQTLSGDGAAQSVGVPLSGLAGFIRVAQQP